MASASSINPADQEPCRNKTSLKWQIEATLREWSRCPNHRHVLLRGHEKAHVTLLLWSFFIKALENPGPYSQKFQGK